MKPSYLQIVEHYEQCFAEHGPGHRGVDWPNAKDAETRYEVMLGIVDQEQPQPTLLDFGCGTAGLYEYMAEQAPRFDDIHYVGHDLSKTYVEYCRQTFPDVEFSCGDVLGGFALPRVDYIVANGVFTEKLTLSTDDMFAFLSDMLVELFARCTKGVAFNVMSKDVDWERDDLFHCEPERIRQLAEDSLGAECVFVDNYGLYEYTAYLSRKASS